MGLSVRRAQRGYATITEVFAPAMSAMAAPVVVRGVAIGVVTITGPAVRLDETRMKQLGGALIETARELAELSAASSFFSRNAGDLLCRRGWLRG